MGRVSRGVESGLTDALADQDLDNLGALVALQLDHLSHLDVIDERAVACKLLCDDEHANAQPRALEVARREARRGDGAGEQAWDGLLKALRSFLGSYSEGTPWSVVMVLRPLRC